MLYTIHKLLQHLIGGLKPEMWLYDILTLYSFGMETIWNIFEKMETTT